MIEIIVILDRSGSMGSVASDAIGGFNSFLETQKKDMPDSKLTLVQFDDQYEIIHAGASVGGVPALNRKTFVPRGCTALYDAIGKTLDDVGKRLDKTAVEQRPSKVMVAILTDGLENASTKYASKQIQDMIKHQRDVYSWEFVFLAANQDAIATGETIGVHVNNAVNIQQSKAGYQATGQIISAAVRRGVSGQSFSSWNTQEAYNQSLAEEEEKQ